MHSGGQLTDEEFTAAKQAVLSGEPRPNRGRGLSRKTFIAVTCAALALVLIALAAVWVTGRHTPEDVAACDAKAADLLSQGIPNADMGKELEAVGCGWRHEQLLDGAGGDLGGEGDMDFGEDTSGGTGSGGDQPGFGGTETSVPEDSPEVGSFADVAGWDDGLQYKVLSVRSFEPSELSIGVEEGMASVEVKVQFTNRSNELMAADFVSIKLLVGSAENEATSFVDISANDGQGSGQGWTSKEHRAGEGEVATFAFQAPPGDLEDGTCVVVFDRGFVGELRVAGPIASS